MPYSKTGETVVLSMDQDDFSLLLFALGLATGAAERDSNRGTALNLLGLVNRLNEGNPRFIPYKLDIPNGVNKKS